MPVDPLFSMVKASSFPRVLLSTLFLFGAVELHAAETPPQPAVAALFNPVQAGALKLPNRVVMAPLTRTRADDGHIPSALMVEYYAQRASAGLIIAEATMVMEGNSSFWREPGIYSEAQVKGWKAVTDAVHAKGGLMVLQLWHGGRACHPALNNGAEPVAPSPLRITRGEIHTPEGKKPYVTPRELRDDELPSIISGFKIAAENAKKAGFDGVEIHGANGYLLDQFLRDGSNKRSGPYGGSIENRARLMLEAVDAAISVFGADRVGLRLSPLNGVNDMIDSDPVAITAYVAQQVSARGIAYLHMLRGQTSQQITADVHEAARKNFKGTLIGNRGYTPEEAAQSISAGQQDAVAFGTLFISNPDLPARIRAGGPFNTPHPNRGTFYNPGPEGYTDFPSLPMTK